MNVSTTRRNLQLVIMVLALLLPAMAGAEFYSYEDRHGTLHFVDDPGKIPKEYRKKVQTRRDEDDALSPEERGRLREKQRQELESAQSKEEERLSQRHQERQEQERLQAVKRQRQAMTTPVAINDRQVFVPVTLTNGSTTTEAMLLLDTGASTTCITPEVASRLNIDTSDYVRVGVAGGKVLRARKASLSRMGVGPVSRENQEVIILRQLQGEMGEGLLGMSFLGGIKHTIDFNRKVIVWHPDSP